MSSPFPSIRAGFGGLDRSRRVVVTGSAGLVGQNLVLLLVENGFTDIVAIDKHRHNLEVLKTINPGVQTILADLADPGDWETSFAGAACLVQLQSQITGLKRRDFTRNTVESTQQVLRAALAAEIPYLVHVSSTVVKASADDWYTQGKVEQERLVRESGLDYCILRPSLMFGWFDPKHLGWLSRFMSKTPVFPIPGDGKFVRQPLYNRDFCRVIMWCMDNQPDSAEFDIVGTEMTDYVDIIRTIKRITNARSLIVHLPYGLFKFLLKGYGVIVGNPPFTADQLDALTAGDEFDGVNTEKLFGLTPTPLQEAFREVFTDERYAHIVLKR